jgi:MFS family permease
LTTLEPFEDRNLPSVESQMRSTLVALTAVITAAATFQLANGVLTSLIPIRLGKAEFDGLGTSLVTAGYPLGFLIGCIFGVRMVGLFGHIRTFAALAAATAVTTLLLEASSEPFLWFVVRVTQGACLAGLFIVADSWINERTPDTVRGRLLSIYAIVVTCALIGGQLLLYFFDAASVVLVMTVSGLFSLALIPVSLTTSTSPGLPATTAMNPLRLYRRSPAAVSGCFAVGMMGAALLNMGPYYLTTFGVSAAQVGLLMGTIHLARLILQWPVGMLSDRVDRRIVIVALCGMIFVLSIAFAIMAPGKGLIFLDAALQTQRPVGFVYFGLLGSSILMLYSVCIAHAHDRGSSADSAEITSTLLLTWSAGSVIGLPLLGLLLEALGEHALFWFTAGAAAVLAVHVSWRMKQSETPKRTGKDDQTSRRCDREQRAFADNVDRGNPCSRT